MRGTLDAAKAVFSPSAPGENGGGAQLPSVDWSFIDAAYVITCPQADGSNPRLDRAWSQLQAVGLDTRCEVREFQPDDEDRIRGCYTSHISVLEAAAARFADKPADEPLNILVLEDNLSISPRISQGTLDSIKRFLSAGSTMGARDMVHLAYIMCAPPPRLTTTHGEVATLSCAPGAESPFGVSARLLPFSGCAALCRYVPGLSVETIPSEEHVVRLKCNADSVLGTTAYIISRSGLDAIMAEHRRAGYVDAIPNVMARLFPESRFAAFPMPLHRAATVKSLVNGQLDNLRALIFQPQVYTQWERLLVSTGQSTNVLFPSLCALLFIGAFAGGGEAVTSILAAARGEQVSLGLPLFSAALSAACLVVLGYGLALAPQPETAKTEVAK